MNRGDPQLGWDTDQFRNDLAEMSLVVARILAAGGFTTGGFNFDAKVRRQSIDPADLFHGHVGGMDMLARALLIADKMLSRRQAAGVRRRALRGLERASSARRSWPASCRWPTCPSRRSPSKLDPKPRSGRQEMLENLVNRYL